MQTAKSILLVEGNNINISPMTNIESLYYEVSENNVVYRKSLYNNFPVFVDYNLLDIENDLSYNDDQSKQYLEMGENSIIKYRDNNNKDLDIIISTLTMSNYVGTNFNVLNVSTFNLSKLLYSYAPKSWVKDQIENALNIINVSLNLVINQCEDVSNRIKDLRTEEENIYSLLGNIYNIEKIYSDASILELMASHKLIPGGIYNLHYNGEYIRETSTLGFKNSMILTFIANSSSSLYSKAINAQVTDKTSDYFVNNDLSKWDIDFDFLYKAEIPTGLEKLYACFNDLISDADKLYYQPVVTFMRDEFGNEAPFDFKNARFHNTNNFAFNYEDINNNYHDYSLYNKCLHNIIESIGTIGNWESYFIIKNNEYIVKYNKIGHNNTNISLVSESNICNNIIDNNNSSISLTNANNITINSSCSNIIISNSNNNFIYSNCDNIKLSYTKNNIIYSNNSSINISGNKLNPTNNNIVMQNCYNIAVTGTNSVIGLNSSNLLSTNSSTYYSSQTFIARGYTEQN